MSGGAQAKESAAPLCEFRNVSKWYGSVIGLNDVSFEIGTGVTGLVGHNGAGKSTLIRLLTGQLRPSLGQAIVQGRPAWSHRAKSHIGYCPDTDAFYEEMSGRSFVRTMARLHGFSRRVARQRTDETLELVGMSDRADRRLASYSKGMRQRIKLAQALVHDPDLIILDEPLNGVDPVGREELVALFRTLTQRGKRILISSHILDDMDRLADTILFICRGRILASGTLLEIRDMLDEHPLKIRVVSDRTRELATRLMKMENVRGVELAGRDVLQLEVHHPKDFYTAFSQLVVEDQFEVERFQTIDVSTEAVFDYLMEKSRHEF